MKNRLKNSVKSAIKALKAIAMSIKHSLSRTASHVEGGGGKSAPNNHCSMVKKAATKKFKF